MRKLVFLLIVGLFINSQCSAQIDFNNIRIDDILGKVITVENGFSPKFYIGNTQIPKIAKVAEILGLKQNEDINRLFNTFRTGRTIYHIASYAGTAVAVYGAIRSINAANQQDYKPALYSGLGAIGTGIIVKLLTKGAANKAVDIFNNTARKKLKDIFGIGAASETMGIGIYVKL